MDGAAPGPAIRQTFAPEAGRVEGADLGTDPGRAPPARVPRRRCPASNRPQDPGAPYPRRNRPATEAAPAPGSRALPWARRRGARQHPPTEVRAGVHRPQGLSGQSAPRPPNVLASPTVPPHDLVEAPRSVPAGKGSPRRCSATRRAQPASAPSRRGVRHSLPGLRPHRWHGLQPAGPSARRERARTVQLTLHPGAVSRWLTVTKRKRNVSLRWQATTKHAYRKLMLEDERDLKRLGIPDRLRLGRT